MKTIGELKEGDTIYHYVGGSLHPFIIDSITILKLSKLIIIDGKYVVDGNYNSGFESGFEINFCFLNKSTSMSISTHNDEEGIKEIKTNREAYLMYLKNKKKRKF